MHTRFSAFGREQQKQNRLIKSKTQMNKDIENGRIKECILLGNTNYDSSELKRSFNNLSVLQDKLFNSKEVGIVLVQEACELQRPLENQIRTQSELYAVLTELGWIFNGPMSGRALDQLCISLVLWSRDSKGTKLWISFYL